MSPVRTMLADALGRIEENYRSFASTMMVALVIVGLTNALALGALSLLLNDVDNVANRARSAARTANQTVQEGKVRDARLATIAAQNRRLVRRLKDVAIQAQQRGARTDVLQCRQIERLKRSIRNTLTLAARPEGRERLLALFQRRECKRLPNSKIEAP